MRLPKNAVGAGEVNNRCFICPEANFCALGTKRSGTEVQVAVGNQIVAVDEPVPSADEIDKHKGAPRFKRVAQLRCTAAEENAAKNADPEGEQGEGASDRVPFFVAVAGIAVPTGSIVTATRVEGAIKVLDRGTQPQRSSFTIDASVIYRPGSSLGVLGTGVGFATMMQPTDRRDISAAPTTDNTSMWLFGLRYDVALFATDWLHRLSAVGGIDKKFGKVNTGVAVGLGLAASFENGPNSTMQAGFLASAMVHLDWQLAWQVAVVLSGAAQGIFVNGNTQALYSGFIGPRVGF
jgi:hypothetical protein